MFTFPAVSFHPFNAFSRKHVHKQSSLDIGYRCPRHSTNAWCRQYALPPTRFLVITIHRSAQLNDEYALILLPVTLSYHLVHQPLLTDGIYAGFAGVISMIDTGAKFMRDHIILRQSIYPSRPQDPSFCVLPGRTSLGDRCGFHSFMDHPAQGAP
ncbi:hypothetical protein BDQ17DRAFT_769956 [Cyathus striatus]|nr:hypothetical protein BDQ17DRAFT_769956 [Cyathus striatus]